MTERTLKRYQVIGELLTQLEAERNELRAKLLKAGSFETKTYRVTVGTYTKRALVAGGIDELYRRFDARKLKGIVAESTHQTVTVRQKAAV